jgi:putative glycosyltransferase (TIGR04348 family)
MFGPAFALARPSDHADQPMRIGLITPAPARSRYGNRVTALRWARLLRELGHNVRVSREYNGENFDLLLALHARRSHPAVMAFHSLHPERPIVVALTGTDLYRDLPRSRKACQSLEIATRVVSLQPRALDRLPAPVRAKTRVIYQSAPKGRRHRRNSSRTFDVCVIGHLRPVKDPFRAALAARRLTDSHRIRVIHVGGAMSPEMAGRARREMAKNPRYFWLGEKPAWSVRKILGRSRLMVLSSKMEGGANVLSEAIRAGVPVLASRIPGSVGILGRDYPGYFAPGDTGALARLLARAERNSKFVADLEKRVRRLAPRFSPERERAAWARLLRELNRRGP